MAALSQWLRHNWRQTLALLLPVCVVYGGLSALEGVAISWIDRWLPVSTFEQATRWALFVTAAVTWLHLCLIGLGAYLILKRMMPAWPNARSFALIWSIASAAVALALLGADYIQHGFQYGGSTYSGDDVRWILLTLIYVKILLVYPGVRLLLGASINAGSETKNGVLAAWQANSWLTSAGLFLLLIALKLTVENVVVSVLSYMPFVAPFWFVLDELSRIRYFAGQGTRIVAESLGVMLYVAFFVSLNRSRQGPGT